MSRASFNILYDGPALIDNKMSVNDLAPALLALFISPPAPARSGASTSGKVPSDMQCQHVLYRLLVAPSENQEFHTFSIRGQTVV